MRYEIPIDAIPQNIAVYHFINDDFIFVDFNSTAEKTEQVKKADLLQKKLLDVFPKAKEFGLYEVMLRVLKTGQSEVHENTFYSDSRISGWRRNHIIRLPNHDIMAIYEDLTALKQLESEAERHKQQLEDAQEIAKIGSWTWQVSNNEVFLSTEMCAILELPNTHQQMTLPELLAQLPDAVSQALQETMKNAVAKQTAYRVKLPFIKHNQHKTLIFSGKPKFVNDQPLMCTGTVQDISNQQDTLDQLAALGLIIDNIKNEVFIFEVDSLKFTFINQAALKNIGYSLPEMLQKTPVDIKPNINAAQFDGLLKKLMQTPDKFITFETVHRRKDGTDYDVEIRLQLLELENQTQFVVIANDITTIKQKRQQLEESEQKFKHIAANEFMGVFIYGETFIYVNQAFCTLLGYTESELLQLSPADLVHPEQKKLIQKMTQRRLKGESFHHQYDDIKLITKSGQIKEVRVATETILYQDQYVGMGTLVDITDIINTKQQLTMLAQVTQQTDDLIKIVNAQGEILFVNQATIKHSGFSETELVGAHTHILKSNHHDEAFYQNLWQTIMAGKVFHNIFVNKKKNGELFYEEETITPILNEAQEIAYFVSTGKDITSRIQMENALKESEQNFRNIFDNASDGIVIHSSDGILLDVNKVIEQRLGYSRNELIGKGLDFIDAPHAAANIPKMSKKLQENGKILFEGTHITKQGLQIPVEINATLIEYQHQPAVLSVVRDISRRKESERALIEAEELYRTLYKLSPVGILLLDPYTTKALEFNQTAHEQLGYSHDEFRQLRISDYELLEKPEETLAIIQKLNTGQPHTFQTQHKTKLGEARDIMVSVQKITLNKQSLLFCLYQDITNLNRFEQEFKTLSLRLSLATKAANIGVWEWDIPNNTLIWDQRMNELYEVNPQSPIDRIEHWKAILDPKDAPMVEQRIEQALQGIQDFDVQYRIHSQTGQIKTIQAMGLVEFDTHKNPLKMVGVNWDISQQKEYEKYLEKNVYLDPLTLIANRRQFDKSFEEEWRRAQRKKSILSICMIDIDFFKNFNDSLGHAQGDVCLKQVAQAINENVSRAGELAARYGGEEFIVLLPNNNAEETLKMAKALCEKVINLKIPHPNSKASKYVTISIGCATLDFSDAPLESPEHLIKQADDALYKAKENGRNRVEVYGTVEIQI